MTCKDCTICNIKEKLCNDCKYNCDKYDYENCSSQNKLYWRCKRYPCALLDIEPYEMSMGGY